MNTTTGVDHFMSGSKILNVSQILQQAEIVGLLFFGYKPLFL